MRGIIGYLGNEGCKDYILSGLKLLQNRGYDSVGQTIFEMKKTCNIY